MPATNPQYVHDRLDLKQNSEEFSDPRCGTINKVTKEPDYCDFDCPILKELILAGKSPKDAGAITPLQSAQIVNSDPVPVTLDEKAKE